MTTITSELINDSQQLVKVTNQYGRELPIYDNGFGPLWVHRDSGGINGVVRTQTWEDAYEICEDEFFPEADETIDELKKDYGFQRESVKIIRDKYTSDERPAQPSDYPLGEFQFVRWETKETPDPEAWIDNGLFQEAYGFRPNGPRKGDKHNHGIYAKDLNGDYLDALTPAMVKELGLTIETVDA